MPPGQQQQNASLKVLLALLACSAVTTRVLAGPRAPPAVQPRLSWNTFVLQQLRSGSPNCRGAPNYPCIIPKDTKLLITSNIKVRSLTIYGDVLVQPQKLRGRGGPAPTLTMAAASKIIIDTAFVVVKGPSARFTINQTAWDNQVVIYLRRNPAAYGDIGDGLDEHAMLGGGRVLTAWQGAQVVLDGYPLKRTWTLMTRDVFQGDNTICVSDDITKDWIVGSTIAIAPSDNVYNIWATSLAVRVGAQVFAIKGMRSAAGTPCCRQEQPTTCSGSMIFLNSSIVRTPVTQPGNYDTVPVYHGSYPPVQAEVLMLDRTITVTGSDISPRYRPIPPPPWKNSANSTGGWPDPWSPYANSSYPVEGLHVLAVGICDNGTANGANCQSGGGFMISRYARVEKAGQRGWIGRYPLHFHKMGDCPRCEFTGNAVVGSTQRGIVIHATHRSRVSNNVVYAAKGAGIYVEEGTEMENLIQENAVVCDVGIASYTKFENGTWVDAGKVDDTSQGSHFGGGGCQNSSLLDFGDPAYPLGGCRVQGTDNDQADCAQQAGIWALSVSNHFIGNRVSNHYNGIYFQSTLFRDGRLGTDSLHRVCPMHSPWGTMRGNVVHSNQRFGWYPDVNYPNAVQRDVGSNGYVKDLTDACVSNLNLFTPNAVCSCRPYTLPAGASNSQPAVLYEDGIDFGNGFVGQYDLADVQYKNFTSINNNIGMYWKGGKNFRSIGTSLIKDSLFSFGSYMSYTSMCCNCTTCLCQPTWPNYMLAQWLAGGAAAVSLVQLPGASATLILENVLLRGSPGHADWLPSGKRNGGQGSALAINQQCKFFKNKTNPLGDLGYDEGALCTPQVLLINVTFQMFECEYQLGFGQQNLPVWVNIGAANGNSYLGMVVAADNSLCGGQLSPCPIRAVVSNYSTHLLNLPGNPCVMPSLTNTSARFGPVWYRRFNGHMICTKQTRRFNIWGPDQGPMLLMPPGGARPWVMDWLGFGIPGLCWGTQCAADEERRWAEGYGATVLSNEELPGVWRLTSANNNTRIDLSKIRMLEFSDEVFGVRFPAETLLLQIDNHRVCTMSSSDPRSWMTQYGPVKRGGGSCLKMLQGPR